MNDRHLRGVELPGPERSSLRRLSLTAGDEAPDFQLPALVDGVKQSFRLSDFRGHNYVILAFYPFNWEEPSALQICEYQAQREQLASLNAEVVGITVESIMNITAWEREVGPINFPLCSDFWPHGATSESYGTLQSSGASERAIFVVDRNRSIAFCRKYSENSVPPIEDLVTALEKLLSRNARR